MPYIGWRDVEARLDFVALEVFDKLDLIIDERAPELGPERPPQQDAAPEDSSDTSDESDETSDAPRPDPTQDNETSIAFRLLLGAPRTASLKDTPIPYSREHLMDLIVRWRLPPQFLQCVRSEEAIFVPFGRTTQNPDQDVSSFIFATPSGRYGRFSLAIAHNIRTRHTRGVLLDGRLAEISDFKDQMSFLGRDSVHPLRAPIVMLESCARILSSRIHKLNTKVGETRFDAYMMTARNASHDVRLGDEFNEKSSTKSAVGNFLTRIFSKSSPGEVQEQSFQENDYSHRTTFFNHIAAEAAFSELRINSMLYLLDRIRSYNKFLDSLLQTEAPNPLHGEYILLEERIEFLVVQMNHLLFRAQFLQQKAQIQISAVYNLIAQRDSLTNIDIAADSRALSNTALQHSSAMKTIAVLTTIFLPGTFVATFFAIPLFNWDAPSNATVTKDRFGWYFAVTIPATVLTICIWQGWIIYHDRAKRIASMIFQRRKAADKAIDLKALASDEEEDIPAPVAPTERDIWRFKRWKAFSVRTRRPENDRRHQRGLASTDEGSTYTDEDLRDYGNRLREEDRGARAVIREANRKTKKDAKGKSTGNQQYLLILR